LFFFMFFQRGRVLSLPNGHAAVTTIGLRKASA